MQGMLEVNAIKKESLKAIIEYTIYKTDKGDYVLQALTLKDLNPEGWN